MLKYAIGIGAFMGLISVVLGALGAHILKGHLDAEALHIFETGARFQMYHAIMLIITGLIYGIWRSQLLIIAGGFFLVGILIFSGSLYALALSDIKILGAIAPIGGLSLMAGWAFLIIASCFAAKKYTARV
tara:strand:+ start:592 stop:984 length:393 start_codon:yes stop_codon:yes gene_type:complete